MKIDAANLSHKELNDALRKDERRFTLTGCCGQRFIAAGMSDKDIAIEGIAGNALGAYLNGACLTVNANAQDAVGDTMNEGKIIVKGSIGDAAGYAMRGGKIFVRGNAGYRAGIHMKEYKGKIPVMIIGGQEVFSANTRPAALSSSSVSKRKTTESSDFFPAPGCTGAKCSCAPTAEI